MQKITGVIAIGLFTSCVAMSAFQTGGQENTSIDTSQPKTWETTVNQAMTSLDEIVKTLMAVAQDEKRRGDDRIAAILLMGRIGTQESIRFLVDNIALEADPEFISGDMMKMWPCVCALAANVESNWNIVHAVTEKIETANDNDLNWFSAILKIVKERKLVVHLIDYRINASHDEDRKKRLEQVKQYLQQE